MIPFLEASLIRPLGLVVAAWLMLRVFRVQHPASRHSVWAAVLVGMLALPLVSVFGPRWTLAVLPPAEVTVVKTATAPASEIVVTETAAVAPLTNVEPASVDANSYAFEWPSSEQLIVGAYLIGVSTLAVYRLFGWLLLRRVLSRSRVLRPACLRESADVLTPVAVGVLRPSVILPADWRTWNVRTRRAVLAHEFAHLRRRDTLIAALGRFVTSVLWFHPAAWWVSRKTSDLAELSCDAVALQRVGDPGGYSRVLVEFASAVNRAGRRVTLPGLAIASGSGMNDRVDQVFEMSSGTMRRLARPRVWLICGISMMCLAATVMLGARPAVQTLMPVKFDVASIKPCPDVPPPGTGRGAPPWSAQLSPGYVHWDCVKLSELIDQAYTDPDHQLLNVLVRPRPDSPKRVRGGPSWVDSERFTVEIRMSGDIALAGPEGAPQRFIRVREAMKPALRSLLEDRFRLKLRTAREEQPMYALTLAKGGLRQDKITRPVPGDCRTQTRRTSAEKANLPEDVAKLPACGTIRMRSPHGNRLTEYSSYTLQNLARDLSSVMDRFVLDKTGASGTFNFVLEYAPDDQTPGDRLDADAEDYFVAVAAARGIPNPHKPVADRPKGDGPSIFKALEGLGLTLEPTKGPAEYFQIDSVQRPRPNAPAAIAVEPHNATTALREREAPDSGPSAPEQNASVPAAQTTPRLAPKFDVVSIKPCPGLDAIPQSGTGRRANPSAPQISPGYVHWDCVAAAELIDQAYAGADQPLLNILHRDREDGPRHVRGGPSWVNDDRFTIEVKVSGDTTDLDRSARFIRVRDAMLPELRAMLEDRFQLKLRRATEQRPMYALTVAAGGLNKNRVTRVAVGECWVWDPSRNQTTPPAGLTTRQMCGNVHGGLHNGNRAFEYTGGDTMPGFAQELSSLMDRYVLDRTGLDGMFKFAFEYAPDDSTPGNRVATERVLRDWAAEGVPKAEVAQLLHPDGPTIFKALEALGLHLDKTTGPSEYLVIESVQKPKPDSPSFAGTGGGR